MREIKFRCWDKVAGLYLSNGNWTGINQDGNPWLVVEGKDVLGDSDRWVVEQYTGLKDKNGREVYEGDIVTDALGNKHTVEWDDEEVRYYFQPVGSTYYYDRVAPETTDYSTMEGRWSVIGNIHENPELLGGED